MQDILRKMKEGTRSRRDGTPSDESSTPEAKATEITKRRQQDGHEGQSDRQEDLSTDAKVKDVAKSLVETGIAEGEDARRIAAEIVGRGYKYEFQHAALTGSPAFFDVQSCGGKILIVLNTVHPVYEQLVEVLEADLESVGIDELKQRIMRASESLDLLISAWARYEDEQPSGHRLDKARDAVGIGDWMARDFLNEE